MVSEAADIQNGNLDYRWLTFADGKTRFSKTMLSSTERTSGWRRGSYVRKCQPGHWFDPFLSVIDSPVTDVDAVVTGCPRKCPPGPCNQYTTNSSKPNDWRQTIRLQILAGKLYGMPRGCVLRGSCKLPNELLSGFYCPGNSSFERPCPIGTYSPNGSSFCSACMAGFYSREYSPSARRAHQVYS